jgi:hypothetical protein
MYVSHPTGKHRIRDISVSIVIGYRLDGQGIGDRFQAGAGNVFFHSIQISFGPPSLISIGTKHSFPWVKRMVCEADHSFPSNAAVNVLSYTFTPHYIFMVWCLIKHGKREKVSKLCLVCHEGMWWTPSISKSGTSRVISHLHPSVPLR